jgi:hypothetical protein
MSKLEGQVPFTAAQAEVEWGAKQKASDLANPWREVCPLGTNAGCGELQACEASPNSMQTCVFRSNCWLLQLWRVPFHLLLLLLLQLSLLMLALLLLLTSRPIFCGTGVLAVLSRSPLVILYTPCVAWGGHLKRITSPHFAVETLGN